MRKGSCLRSKKIGLFFKKIYLGDTTWHSKWYQIRVRFYKLGNYKMDIGVNIRFLKSYYIIGFHVPFAKWINRKKYIKIVEETNRRNKEYDFCHNDEMYVDDYGHVCLGI